MAEDIRSGIRAIPVVQFEASRALGFGFLQTMRRVVYRELHPRCRR